MLRPREHPASLWLQVVAAGLYPGPALLSDLVLRLSSRSTLCLHAHPSKQGCSTQEGAACRPPSTHRPQEQCSWWSKERPLAPDADPRLRVALGTSLGLIAQLLSAILGRLVWLVAPHLIVGMLERGNVCRGDLKKNVGALQIIGVQKN